ncbi:DNA alkylation repair protein [Candidatus Uhrbacteria bacterium]|nr:DNA alkylation repair protein [Candidatus Uhrbacteria bacterium]MBD3284302.1 DNA alkylation repair protein [Candidatus Uhrbacteria bacterium]
MSLSKLKAMLRSYATKERATANAWFFKTGKGQYGEGDRFLGVTVPNIRKTVRAFPTLPLKEVIALLKSPWHEERLTALFILIHQFQKGDPATQKKIYNLYLKSTKWINNWDLVDLSAHKIVGAYLIDKPRKTLYELASSPNLWQRRIAILATFWYIKDGDVKDAIKIAQLLLNDKEDLIHKAVGWMLREVGKKDLPTLESFLKKHAPKMPRTMLRYAIEKFPETKRQRYLKITRD